MIAIEVNTLSEYIESLTLSGGNKLILTDPSPSKGRGNNGWMKIFSEEGCYG